MKKVKDKSTIVDLHRVVTDKRLERIERMLKWIVIECIPAHKKKGVPRPDISDILKSGK